MNRHALLYTSLFIATIVAANAAIERWGIIPVGFGLSAPAGVLFAGLAFTFRDLLHDQTEQQRGRWPVLAAIIAGAVLSWGISPQFAAASGIAFLLSELADFAVYAPLRRRYWLRAVVLSNTVGLLVDSALFLWLAFGALDHLGGQVLAKSYMTAAAVLMLMIIRVRTRHTVQLELATKGGGGAVTPHPSHRRE